MEKTTIIKEQEPCYECEHNKRMLEKAEEHDQEQRKEIIRLRKAIRNIEKTVDDMPGLPKSMFKHELSPEDEKAIIESWKKKTANWDIRTMIEITASQRGAILPKSDLEHLNHGIEAVVHSYQNPDHQHGSFITHLVAGRLYSAMKHADGINLRRFWIYMHFINENVPAHLLPPILRYI